MRRGFAGVAGWCGEAEPVTTFQIRDAVAGDLAVLRHVFRRSSLSNDEDRALLLSHPEVLELSDLAVTEARTRAAVCDDVIVGFASWIRTGCGREPAGRSSWMSLSAPATAEPGVSR